MRLAPGVLVFLAACGGAREQAARQSSEVASSGAGGLPEALASFDPQQPGDVFVVDLRAPEAFAERHVRGSINLQWGYEQFRVRHARLFPKGARLVILGPDAAEVEAAVELARSRGPAEGHVLDPGSLPLPERLTAALPVLTAQQLQMRLRAGDLLLLDARTAKEYADAHVPGALFLYPDDVGKVAPGLRRDRDVAVICAGGWRSSMVASWLQRAGFGVAYNVIGGMTEWRQRGLPIEKGGEQVDFR